MKILLDENLPHRLRHHFLHHETVTALWMGWTGIQNGELLDLAEAHSFDLFVTADQGIPFQQNLRKRKVAIMVLATRSTDFDVLEPLIPRMQEALETVKSGKVVYIEG